MSAGPPIGFEPAGDEQRMDVARYVAALRRSGWLIALIVVPLTLAVLALSLALPKSYSATATLVVEERADTPVSPDAASATRRLATIRQLLTSRDVLADAAGRLPGESLDTLRDKVEATADDDTDILQVQATDGDAAGAAAIANGVAQTFLQRRRAAERQRFAEARTRLERALADARARGASAAEQRALRERLSELGVSAISTSDGLELAQLALPPDSPDSPRPLQNAVFALFASLFLAVLAALARDLIAPRIADPRQLMTLTGLAPLVVLPAARRSRSEAQVREACEALAASLRVQLSRSQRVVLVTGATAGDQRSAITVGLGRALAASGEPTLVVSADLRHPDLHRQLGVPAAPGLADVLDAIERAGGEDAGRMVRAATRAGEHPSYGELRALLSGRPAQHPAASLSGDALGVVFEQLARSEYRYVLVEGPPLLGPIDGQLVARWADAVLVVCRLESMSPADGAELGALLGRLDAPVLGAVVIGGRRLRYSLPAWTPVRAPLAQKRRARSASSRPR